MMLYYQFLLAHEKHYEKSVEIAALVLNQAVCPPVYQSFPIRQVWEKQVLEALSKEVFEEADERGRSLDLESVIQEILSQAEQ